MPGSRSQSSALAGNFTYNNSNPQTVNVLALATSTGNIAATDPTIVNLLNKIRAAAGTTGNIQQSATSPEKVQAIKIPPTGIALEEIERVAIVEALKMSNWIQKDAAELLSISPRVMNYKIKTLGIDSPRGRRAAAVATHEETPAAV